jgi:aminopeptidase N
VKTDTPQTIFLKDYTEPNYWIDNVDLRIELGEDETLVHSTLSLRRNANRPADAALVLDGQDMELRSIAIDGTDLAADDYAVAAETLNINKTPNVFQLSTTVALKPQENTALEGLYKASGIFCTQCEAEGFRKITYYLDRPDVMADFTTTIVGDKKLYPVLLSNGNPVERGDLDGGKHFVKWVDPFKKPAYLFAVVAGDLKHIEDKYTTTSGREVLLQIFVEPENIDKCDHAMLALKQSMKWDEDVFGLEYDLDIYMIVAVNDFNMGAMENKGLNVFNSKYVLARKDTATDTDFDGIQGVIGHEYFHNWSGNRVTCRDWFQLSLKEGLTVFRDQEFSADLNSRAVKRIQDVKLLRTHQFAEDASPMSHPIRPEAFIEINNFYTRTVYEKGAEVVRMYHTLLGAGGFRKGMDLYWERHDGQAVTCDDFVSAMQDANGADLTQFKRWYSQSGTPRLKASMEYDAAGETATLHFEQSCPPTPGQETKEAYVIPVKMGLLGADGADMAVSLEAGGEALAERVIEVRETKQSVTFHGVKEKPVPSLLRGFSAPVILDFAYDDADLAFLLANDSDSFSRWEAGQTLGIRVIMGMIEDLRAGKEPQIPELVVEAFRRLLTTEGLDKALLAESLTLPSEAYLAEKMEVVDVDNIHAARKLLKGHLATSLRAEFETVFNANQEEAEYTFDAESVGRRDLKNTTLSYLMELDDAAITTRCFNQYEAAHNMTDVMAALGNLADTDTEERTNAFAAFYDKWQDDALVTNKWFSLQAMADRETVLDEVKALTKHPAFSMTNPNRLRSLIGVFCMGNRVHFHALDGSGYSFLGDTILALNDINPQVAARLMRILANWRRFDEKRQALIKVQLERIVAHDGLSKDVFEVASKSLA